MKIMKSCGFPKKVARVCFSLALLTFFRYSTIKGALIDLGSRKLPATSYIPFQLHHQHGRNSLVWFKEEKCCRRRRRSRCLVPLWASRGSAPFFSHSKAHKPFFSSSWRRWHKPGTRRQVAPPESDGWDDWNPLAESSKLVADVLEKDMEFPGLVGTAPAVIKKSSPVVSYQNILSCPLEQDVVNVPLSYTVDQCIDFVRSLHSRDELQVGDITKDLDRLYVTDNCVLVGHVPLASLLISNGSTPIKDLVKPPEVVIELDARMEDALDSIQESEVSQAPIVDNFGNLVGVLMPQELFKQLEAEATDDMMRYSGSGSGDSYFGTSLRKLVWSRGTWLVSLMALQSLSSAILTRFSAVIERNIVLALFLTMLTGSAGNAGNQSSAMVIRGLATGEINKENSKKVLWRETRGAMLLGALLSLTSFVRVVTTKGATAMPAMVVSLAMGLTVVGAVVMGTIVPLILERFGMDPVNFASPALATLTDIAGVLILCSMSSAIL